MSVTADRRRRLAVWAPALAVLAVVAGTEATAAIAGVTEDYSLTVVDQTFSVTAGESLHLDVLLTASAAGLADIQAAAETTTTSTTLSAPTTSPPTSPAPALTPPTSRTPTAAPSAPSAPSPTTVADADGFAGRTGPPPPTGAAGEIVVTLHEPIADAAELSAVDAGGPGRPLDSTAVALTDVIDDVGGSADDPADASVEDPRARGAASGQVSVTITLADDDATTLGATSSGIHPVSLELRLDGVTVATTSTFVQVIDPAGAAAGVPLQVAILASIADPGPWADAQALATAQADLGRIAELAAATDAPLTLSIPPSVARAATAPSGQPAGGETVDTAVTGTLDPDASTPATAAPSAPATAVSAAAVAGSTVPATSEPAPPTGRLADQIVGDELLSRPLVPLDPSSMADIDATPLFTEQLRRGEEALATAGPHAVRARTVWVAAEPISRGGADALRDLGVQMVIMPGDIAAAMGVTEQTFAIDLGNGATLPGIVSSPLGERLIAASEGRSSSNAAIRLLVEVVLQRDGGSSSGLVLATGPSGVPDPAVTAAFVRYASATPDVSVVGVSKLTGVVGTAGRDDIVTASAGAAIDLSARSADVDALRPSAEAAASMLVDPAPANGWDNDFVRVLASTLDDEQAAQHLAATAADIEGYLDAVVPPERFTFGITGTSSELPLRIGNTSDQPLNVIVRVASPKLETSDVATELQPGENVVKIPLTARSNGTFSVEVSVLTPTYIDVARPVVLKADVTGLSGVSRVITIGALLALASWWYSHFRKRRRARIGDAAPAMRLEPGPTLSPDAAESRGPD